MNYITVINFCGTQREIVYLNEIRIYFSQSLINYLFVLNKTFIYDKQNFRLKQINILLSGKGNIFLLDSYKQFLCVQ